MNGNNRAARRSRLRLESLEDRSVPTTFNVTTTLDVVNPADGKRSLREAVTQANITPGPDTIVLPAGVFKIALGGSGENANATGDLDVTGTVTIRGAGAGQTVIDGQQLDRVFDVTGTAQSSIRVVLENLTVHSGNVTGHGGGVRVGNADLVVRDCTVAGNRASLSGGGISNGDMPDTGLVRLIRTTVARNVAGADGGGVFVAGLLGDSEFTVRDSTVRRNIAGADGGGIAAEGTANLANCTVSGNSAVGFGGGIAASGANLTNCTISGNFAGEDGGGIRTDQASANLTNCTVSGNSAGVDGGGIAAETTANLTNCTVSGNSAVGFGGGIATSGANLTNCTVNGNSAGEDGGGIRTDQASANLTNCTVSGNFASVDGGGIAAETTANLTNCTVSGNFAGGFVGGGIAAHTTNLTNCTVSGNSSSITGGGIAALNATLLNCTIVENNAQTGGGLFQIPGGTFALRNTLVALNLVGFGGSDPDVSGAFTSQGHNLIGNGTGGTGLGVNGDLVGTSVNPIDPKIGALKINGGKTKTHALLAGSPAIDKGENAGVPATDQRGVGFPREKDGNGDGVAVVDIGAFER